MTPFFDAEESPLERLDIWGPVLTTRRCILGLCAHSDRCFNLKSVDESFGHDHQEGNFG
jgi:hypothetical protein